MALEGGVPPSFMRQGAVWSGHAKRLSLHQPFSAVPSLSWLGRADESLRGRFVMRTQRRHQSRRHHRPQQRSPAR
jgi:hypothetical protein